MKNGLKQLLSIEEQYEYKYGETAKDIIKILQHWLDKNLKDQNLNVLFEGKVWTYMTMDYLARNTHKSVSTVNRAIKKLRDDHVIWVAHYARSKSSNVNYYTLNVPKYQNVNYEGWTKQWQKQRYSDGKRTNQTTEEKLCDRTWAEGLSLNRHDPDDIIDAEPGMA